MPPIWWQKTAIGLFYVGMAAFSGGKGKQKVKKRSENDKAAFGAALQLKRKRSEPYFITNVRIVTSVLNFWLNALVTFSPSFCSSSRFPENSATA